MHQVQPRISLFAAVDSFGEVYIAISQENTNNDTFRLFLTYLIKELTRDRPNFREDTVFLFDGAGYHTSNEVQAYMAKLELQVIFTGPRSYDTCPVELFFAYFKNEDLNPTNQKTGKL